MQLDNEWLVLAGVITGFIALAIILFFAAMARFLKRPSPSEAIIRIGRVKTEVFIARATWVIPVLHRSTTMSLSTIGITTRRTGHDALVSRDFISTNLAAEFYIRVEPNEDDVKKAARTIGIDEGHASAEQIRQKAQELLEPKLVGAIRAVAAESDFLTLHLKREEFAKQVSDALREDLGRNGFTLESVTITDLSQTPLAEMRSDDIFGASGRETVTNTVVQKNIAVRKKLQEEAEQTATIEREREIRVAQQTRLMKEGKAKEEEAGAIAELSKNQAIETRDLQRQAAISVERARKDETEIAASIAKQRTVEAAQIEKEKVIEAAGIDKVITLTLKAKETIEAEAQRATAMALKEKADQEVITVQHVADADRKKRVVVIAAEQDAERQKIGADVAAYQKNKEAEASANAAKAAAEGRADAARFDAQGVADAIKIKAKAEADAAAMQAEAITKLAEARREAGLKEAEVERQKVAAANAKTPEILLAEAFQALVARGPELMRELVKPAEKISEFKILHMGGGGDGGNGKPGALGSAMSPIARTLLEASAMMPLLQSVMKGADGDGIARALAKAAPGFAKPIEQLTSAGKPTPPVPPTARRDG